MWLTSREKHVDGQERKAYHTDRVANFGSAIPMSLENVGCEVAHPAGRLPRDKMKHSTSSPR